MPTDVGQRLLDDAVGVTRDLVGQAGKVVGMETDRDAGPLGRLSHQGLDGGLQAKLVEDAGPQLAGDAAHDLHRLVDPVGERPVAPAEGARISGAPALEPGDVELQGGERLAQLIDRKSTRLNSSHGYISYAVFCLKKKKSNKSPTSYDRAA